MTNLFDTLSHWLNSPNLAYASWLEEQSLKDSTKTVYLSMFSRFCQWLEGQGQTIPPAF